MPKFGGAGFGGLWIAFIGWFLLQAAQASYAQVAVVADLRGVRVRDIMSRDCPVVSVNMSVQILVDEHLLRTGQRCFAVVGDPDRIVGLTTSHEIKGVVRDRWAMTPLSDVMRPIGQLRTIQPDMLAIDALTLMGREDVNQLPVIFEGKFEGMVARRHILQLLQTRAELRMPATPNTAVPLTVTRKAPAPASSQGAPAKAATDARSRRTHHDQEHSLSDRSLPQFSSGLRPCDCHRETEGRQTPLAGGRRISGVTGR